MMVDIWKEDFENKNKSKMDLREQFEKLEETTFENKDLALDQLEKIADDFAIGFSKWIEDNYTHIKGKYGKKNTPYWDFENLTLLELLVIYKQTLNQ